MGMTLTGTFPPGSEPAWPAVARRLNAAGRPVQVRMIDGQLAFPDEEPPADWRELRVSGPAGMVTLLRSPGRVQGVTWGNAAEDLRQVWLAGGQAIASEGGEMTGDVSGEGPP